MKKRLWYIWAFVKCVFGFGNVNDGSICWFSEHFFDVHDYHQFQGGDGYPSHFYQYTCHKCSANFGI